MCPCKKLATTFLQNCSCEGKQQICFINLLNTEDEAMQPLRRLMRIAAKAAARAKQEAEPQLAAAPKKAAARSKQEA
ncbi:Hypothetical predicted protein [Podarcis lilfordi]|uniref:Uncharacterized protein n=1 Tax=Podarcis lilfordi TaxID=74358 RepID=A0AA35LD68_9SAUR|nr:Hypothetical predicted protein [Podarcis lilfordi]